jgi:hypothetical protein
MGQRERFDWAMTVIVLALLIFWGMLTFAHAHDQWADGSKVPDWVKNSCCGVADAHHLTPDQVRRVSATEARELRPAWKGAEDGKLYYVVDGYRWPVLASMALPSQDGDYWIFYRDEPAGPNCSPEGPCQGSHEASQSGVYCFFVPMDF